MKVNAEALIAMTEANENFSKVVRLVDTQGSAVILKNNKPGYAVISINEYDQFQAYRSSLIGKTADQLISENLEAFQELAK